VSRAAALKILLEAMKAAFREASAAACPVHQLMQAYIESTQLAARAANGCHQSGDTVCCQCMAPELLLLKLWSA
jgi:hypothetical protein